MRGMKTKLLRAIAAEDRRRERDEKREERRRRRQHDRRDAAAAAAAAPDCQVRDEPMRFSRMDNRLGGGCDG